jgi:hypothetical protein
MGNAVLGTYTGSSPFFGMGWGKIYLAAYVNESDSIFHYDGKP